MDSAGLIDEHEGERPDSRMLRAAEARGYSLPGYSRPITREDLDHFDFILAMDRQNLAGLDRLSRQPAQREKIFLLTHWLGNGEVEVPDPYYGGMAGFERVLDMVEESTDAFLQHLKESLR